MNPKEFSESAKGFTKSPLGIIALFIILVYGFASLVVGFAQAGLKENITPLIYFLVTFPVVVFFGFLWLVAKHHNKLYGPSDFKDEENFLKTQISSAVSLGAALSKHSQSGEKIDQTQLNEIVDLVSKTTQKPTAEKWRNRILWVDDRPENNIYERQAFEAQGLTFQLALSTAEALNYLEREKFAAIISDMGRKEGSNEGYVLLSKIREMGLKTPYVIYAGSNLPEHKRMARENGALGATNKASELFEMVMNVIHK